MMNDLDPEKKFKFHGDVDESYKMILEVGNRMKTLLIDKYSISQTYFHTQMITKMVEDVFSTKKQKNKHVESIIIKDIGFNEEDEFMDKLYQVSETEHQLPELFEYYKYYTQQPICFLKHQFDIMFDYQERKKAYLYNKLKKVLELSQTAKSLESLDRAKKQNKQIPIGNILTFLSDSRPSLKYKTEENDESYCFREISQKLNKMFGPSRTKTINKIDQNYKFMTHNISFQRPKKSSELTNNPNLKTMLESTNISSKNGGTKKNNKGQKGHKRYVTAQLYRSPIQAEKKRLKRRSSMDCMKMLANDKNQLKREEVRSRKCKIKKNEENKGKQFGTKTDSDFKLGLEEMKKRIQKQKEMMCQTLSMSKTRTKKK